MSIDPSIKRFLDECQRLYEREDNKWCLMQAIYICAREEMPLPQWAANAYMAGFRKIEAAECSSWDDVLGRVFKKGTNLAAFRKRKRLRWRVYTHVQELSKSQPIDEALFEQVGSLCGIGKTLASEYYYECKKISSLFGIPD